MNVFIIHSMGMSNEAIEYAEKLEEEGHITFVPARDTEQYNTTRHGIISNNLKGIEWADEIHMFWDLSSLGSIFDLGSAYALGKPVKIVKTKRYHWTKFIDEYEDRYIWLEGGKEP